MYICISTQVAVVKTTIQTPFTVITVTTSPPFQDQ